MKYLNSKHSLEEVLTMFDPFVAVADGDVDNWNSLGYYCTRCISGICHESFDFI